jgi:hypothetical protein
MRTILLSILVLCLVSCEQAQPQSNQIAATAANIHTVSNHKQTFLCGAETKSGTQCKKHVKEQGLKCYLHGGATTETVATTQCEGTTKQGKPCKKRTKSGFCHLHSK